MLFGSKGQVKEKTKMLRAGPNCMALLRLESAFTEAVNSALMSSRFHRLAGNFCYKKTGLHMRTCLQAFFCLHVCPVGENGDHKRIIGWKAEPLSILYQPHFLMDP